MTMETVVTKIRRAALDEFSEWRESQSTLIRLQLEERELDQHLDEINRAVTDHPAQATSPIAAAAERLLDTGEMPDLLEMERLRRDRDSLRTRRKIVRMAIGSHRERMEGTRSRIGEQIREALEPEHEALAQRVAAALIELGHACAAERDFRDEVREGGFGSAMFRPMAFFAAGDPRDGESRTAKFLLEAVEFGFIADLAIIPAEWRKRWNGAAERMRRAAGENGFAPPLPAPAAPRLRRVRLLTGTSADATGVYGPGRIMAVPEDSAARMIADRQATPLDFRPAEAAD